MEILYLGFANTQIEESLSLACLFAVFKFYSLKSLIGSSYFNPNLIFASVAATLLVLFIVNEQVFWTQKSIGLKNMMITMRDEYEGIFQTLSNAIMIYSLDEVSSPLSNNQSD